MQKLDFSTTAVADFARIQTPKIFLPAQIEAAEASLHTPSQYFTSTQNAPHNWAILGRIGVVCFLTRADSPLYFSDSFHAGKTLDFSATES